MAHPETQRSSRILSTLQHGLWALEALSRGALTAQELSDRLAIGLRATYDVLLTLEREGHVCRFPNGQYGLGGMLAILQRRAVELMAPAECASDALAELHQRTGMLASINGWYGNEIVVQLVLQDSRSGNLSEAPIQVGFREWSTTRCSTRAILAFLSPERLRQVLACSSHNASPPARPIKELATLLPRLQQIARQGYALDLGDSRPQMGGVAAPFFDQHGFPTGALALSAPLSLFQSRAQTLGREVVEVAVTVSSGLGYRGSYPPPSPLLASGREAECDQRASVTGTGLRDGRVAREPWLVSDELWELVEPLLAAQSRPRPRPGRKRLSDRAALQGVLFVLCTGIAWQQLPQSLGFGSGVTCWRRLQEWRQAGVWERLKPLLVSRLQAPFEIEWSRAATDSGWSSTNTSIMKLLSIT